MSVNWVPCGMSSTKTEGTELGGIELRRSSLIFKVGGHVDHFRGHPDVVPAVALWVTRSHIEVFCNLLSRFEVFHFFKRGFGNKFSSKITIHALA